MLNRLQGYRVWKGLQQKKLAELSGVSVSEIRLIEKNKVNPQLKTKKALSDVIDANIDQIFPSPRGMV